MWFEKSEKKSSFLIGTWTSVTIKKIVNRKLSFSACNYGAVADKSLIAIL